MSELTTERLEKRIKNCIEVGNSCVMLPVSVAEELLAYRKTENHLLDNDGSRGKFSAVQSYDARENLERLLSPTAQQNKQQNNPTVRSDCISFDALMAAVNEVRGVKREFDATPEKCYQAVPFMNFNSLSRVVEMFRTAQPVSEPYNLPVGYFSYGSECGFDWHKTEKEALESAEAAIDDYRGDACDGWSEETDSVCWGVILQQATKVDERPRTDDDKCDPAIDTVCDYALLPELVGNSPVIPDGWKLVPIEPTENMIIEGFESEPDKTFSKPEVWEEYAAMSGCKQAAYRAKLCWAAMLATAPAVQESKA